MYVFWDSSHIQQTYNNTLKMISIAILSHPFVQRNFENKAIYIKHWTFEYQHYQYFYHR